MTETLEQARERGRAAGEVTRRAMLVRELDTLEARAMSLRGEIIRMQQLRREYADGRVPLPIPDGYVRPGVVAPILCDGLAPTEVVYALVDPEDPELVRYIGRTHDPVTRYRHHCTEGTEAVFAWTTSLIQAGRSPLMLLVERCAAADIAEREAHWIHHYRDRHHADLNRSIPRRQEVLV